MMRLTRVPLSFAVVIAACGGVEDDPSTLLAENTESIQVRDDVPAENEPDLIAALSLDNGNALKFYESSVGGVWIVELGMYPPVSTTRDLQSMSLGEIYQTFAPGHSVPEALTAAQRRLDAPGALENVTLAKTDVEPFANHDDVAMTHDANQDDGTKDDDAVGHQKRRYRAATWSVTGPTPIKCTSQTFRRVCLWTQSDINRCTEPARFYKYFEFKRQLHYAIMTACADANRNVGGTARFNIRGKGGELLESRGFRMGPGEFATATHQVRTGSWFRMDATAQAYNRPGRMYLGGVGKLRIQ